MAAYDDFQTYIAAAYAAIGSEDWATARTKILQAKAAAIAVPNSGSDGTTMQLRSNELDQLWKMVNEAQGKGSNSLVPKAAEFVSG